MEKNYLCKSKHFRPNDVNYLRGDAKKASKKLNWKPKYNLNKIVKEMIDCELIKIKKLMSKILITGASGMAGKNLLPLLKTKNYLTPSSKELNLMNKTAVKNYLKKIKLIL